MKSSIRLLPALGLLLVLPELPSAHATEPPAAPTATQTQTGDAATPAQAPSDTSAASQPSAGPAQSQAANSSTQPVASPATSKVVLVDKTLTDSQVKQLLARGYKPQQRGDSIYYCRRETVLGSHFENKVCKTAEEIARDERDSKEMVERMRRANGANPNLAP